MTDELHPTPAELTAYCNGSLRTRESALLEKHAFNCVECSQLIAEKKREWRKMAQAVKYMGWNKQP